MAVGTKEDVGSEVILGCKVRVGPNVGEADILGAKLGTSVGMSDGAADMDGCGLKLGARDGDTDGGPGVPLITRLLYC